MALKPLDGSLQREPTSDCTMLLDYDQRLLCCMMHGYKYWIGATRCLPRTVSRLLQIPNEGQSGDGTVFMQRLGYRRRCSGTCGASKMFTDSGGGITRIEIVARLCNSVDTAVKGQSRREKLAAQMSLLKAGTSYSP
jgi:hypothetical protein